MARYFIRDNRGSNPNMLPHEAFSAVQVVNYKGRERNAVTVCCYTRDEAEKQIEIWRREAK